MQQKTGDSAALLSRATAALRQLQEQLDAVVRSQREPIAIIGMACRLPGDVHDPSGLWELLRSGRDAIGEIPRERWDFDAFYDAKPQVAGKMYTRHGGFLKRVEDFDRGFFDISEREAVQMDPQHRFTLEVTWEALESAGQRLEQLEGSRTGVFLGLSAQDFMLQNMHSGDPRRIDPYAGTGTTASVAAGRISYVFGWMGPSMTLDTACSSSLVSVHQAIRSLRTRECDLAVAGGVSLILAPQNNIYFSLLMSQAPDGRCKTFDAAANGFVRSEGCGMVVLKRLSEALRDGDPIAAVIRGSAINHDGRSNGLTAPNGRAQQMVIKEALRDAGLEPQEVGYVEAHGTGTKLGDPIELAALSAVYGQGRTADAPIAIGSLKTNMGHLEPAAGIAGLIKAALVVRNREVPPHLHLKTPNPLFDWTHAPLRVLTAHSPWFGTDAPARAAVSAFGFSGTNAHVILEGPPAREARQEAPDGAHLHLVPVSARSEAALRAQLARYADWLERTPGLSLEDFAHTAGARRSHHRFRAAVAGRSRDEIAAALRQQSLRPGPWSAPTEPPRIAWAFTALPGHWRAFAAKLLASEPRFAQTCRQWSNRFQARLGVKLDDWLAGESLPAETPAGLDVSVPGRFVFTVALAELWRAWGVVPEAVLGHGEALLAAAFVAGRLSPDAVATALESAARRESPARASWSASLPIQAAGLPLYSTVSGGWLQGHELTVAGASGESLRGHVARLIREGHGLLLELGAELPSPDATLQSIQVASIPEDGEPAAALRRALTHVYMAGASLSWGTLSGERGQCVPLPSYAWQHEALWPGGVSRREARGPNTAWLHPLVQRCTRRDAQEVHFASELSTRSHPELRDHQVQGRIVFPGAGYFEMARAACTLASDSTDVELRDVDIVQMLPLGSEKTSVQVVVKGDAFTITSQDENGRSRVHAKGHHGAPLRDVGGAGWPDLRERGVADEGATQVGPEGMKGFYAMLTSRGLDYGPAFALVERLRHDTRRFHSWLRPVTAAEGSETRQDIPPALLDAAFHGLAVVEPPDAAGGTYVPVGVKRLRFRGTPRGATEVLGQWSTEAPTQGVRVCDLLVRDVAGDCIAEVEGFRVKSLRQVPESGRDDEPAPALETYVPTWVRAETPSAREARPLDGVRRVAVFSDTGGLGDRLCATLSARGTPWVKVLVGEHSRRVDDSTFIVAPKTPGSVLTDAIAACSHVVYLWALGVSTPETARSVDEAQALTCAGPLALAQAMGRMKQQARILFVTRHAQQVEPSSGVPGLSQAPLWGFGRSLAQELPERYGGLLDLDGGPLDAQVDELLSALNTEAGEDQRCLREGERWVLRMQPAPLPEVADATRGGLRADAHYLITGGLGDLGLHVAEWMARSKAGHVTLVGRRAPEAAKQARIDAMRTLGLQVHVVQADITDREQVRALVEQLPGPPLRGVIHAAAELADGLLRQHTWESFSRAFTAKVQGALWLDQATRAHTLDFFWMFSSASAVLGSAGQSNYAAANAWLDALALARRASGLPATSINWGPWAGTGLMAQVGGRQGMERQGVSLIAPERGIECLPSLLSGTAPQVVIGRFAWAKLATMLHTSRFGWLAALGGAGAEARGAVARGMLDALPASERREAVTALILRLAAQLLPGNRSSNEIHPDRALFELGLDSLAALHLKDGLQRELSHELPSVVVFDSPTIAELATHLLKSIWGEDTEARPASSAQAAAPDTGDDELLVREIAGLTEDEFDQAVDDLLRDVQ
ncbi:type I polyketide synthase [Myxococcus sp. AM009]|uniref:type I polyketide synthase n=1 Tax=Myxococcus sp. AM009 TaxID=2745137 RepID=UPI0015956BE6|nr:type I polyketide synthase [Myxococcus sp. AM009]NVI97752.1 type I polyketide synthase [Myxococcus sp. AM009]